MEKSDESSIREIASTSSSWRKRKDMSRHDSKGALTAVLEKGNRGWIRNLPERGGTGKMRSFWEDKVYVVIENLNSENITYKVLSENDLNRDIRTLHSSMLLPCENLVDKYNWSLIGEDHISNHKSKENINKITAKRREKSKEANVY